MKAYRCQTVALIRWVCTWTLCSIPLVERAILEVHRLLKTGGKFFFIEHGLSCDRQVRVWQNRLTPIQKVIADGCHLNRAIRRTSQTAVSRGYCRTVLCPKITQIYWLYVSRSGYQIEFRFSSREIGSSILTSYYLLIFL